MSETTNQPVYGVSFASIRSCANRQTRGRHLVSRVRKACDMLREETISIRNQYYLSPYLLI
jgi:hypothetical protein